MRHTLFAACMLVATIAQLSWASVASGQSRDVYFGDLHLHSSWSADASLGGNLTGDPDLAYRYARGYPVVHPKHGARVRIDRPLDFLAVSDPPRGLP